jgi:succinate-semialdehyde dehydrogenase/glutarate-semialdehyde dehydrogenase
MISASEETFRPVALLSKFTSEDEVVHLANATPFGLAASIFTQVFDRMWRVTGRLETRIVGVDGGPISNEVAPFSGIKESDLRREDSRYGLDEGLMLKYVLVTHRTPKFDLFAHLGKLTHASAAKFNLRPRRGVCASPQH